MNTASLHGLSYLDSYIWTTRSCSPDIQGNKTQVTQTALRKMGTDGINMDRLIGRLDLKEKDEAGLSTSPVALIVPIVIVSVLHSSGPGPHSAQALYKHGKRQFLPSRDFPANSAPHETFSF